MAYCSVSDIDNILAQSLTSATNPTSQAKRNLLQIGKVRDKNTISDDIVRSYIQDSSEEIDSTFNQLYTVPFCEVVVFETKLLSDLSDYNSYLVLKRACALASGDEIILKYEDVEERYTIDEVFGNAMFSTAEAISYPFPAGSRLLQIKFPDPIRWVASRLAAANLFDKYFSAEASPNVSEYGKLLRKQARQKINNVLNGRTHIIGARRVGRRLYNPYISEQYGLPRGQEGQHDIDDLG